MLYNTGGLLSTAPPCTLLVTLVCSKAKTRYVDDVDDDDDDDDDDMFLST